MSFMSMFTLVVLVMSKIIMLNIGEVYYILSRLFPQVAEKFVQTVFSISKQSEGINTVLVVLALYFSKDFFVALSNAFSFVTQARQKKKYNLYVMILSMPVVVLLVTLLYILKVVVNFVLSYFISVVTYLETLFGHDITMMLYYVLVYTRQILAFGFVFEFVALFVFILSAYYLMIETENTAGRHRIYIAAAVSAVILIFKTIFGIISSMILTKNPLFLVIGSVFVVIVWMKLMFDAVLLGARVIFYIEKAPIEETLNSINKV